MQRFKNNMSDGWLFRQELRLFKNFMRNWKRDVDDCDFFDIFANGNNTTENEAKAFLKKYFSLETLAKCDSVSVERVRDKADDEGRIVDFSFGRCSTDGLMRELWNTDKSSRARCREMLEEWCDVLEKRKSRNCRRKDPMETRMDEICRVLKLNEVERDILVYAAVRLMTCFDDFPVGSTNGRNDRAMFIAMAIDRPCSMVTNALAANGKLRRYEVLDNDGDLGRGSPFRNYLECGDGEMLEGQFYKKAPTDDALPWDYYGKLVE